MVNFGDITKINGYDVPIVDCVIGGSPCQDLSVAGKRAGLKHEANGDEETTRSGLFMEQIRLIKEQRENYVRTSGRTDDIRPRYGIWENVEGVKSSGKYEDENGKIFKGEDFSVSSSKSSAKSQTPKLLFLDLTNGKTQDVSSEKTTVWHTVYSMLNGGESPKDVNDSVYSAIGTDIQPLISYLERASITDKPSVIVETHLSEVLETNPDPRYNLSARACQGILTRAERRGKELPTLLKEALEQVIEDASGTENR